jgi:deoxyribonuclease-4
MHRGAATNKDPLAALTRPLGRHLGTGQGMMQAIAAAHRIGCSAAQIFPGNPKGWRHVPLSEERARMARQGWAEAGIRPLVLHAPYIVNLASPEPDLAQNSRRAVSNAFDRAQELGAAFVVVHLGSHKGTGEEAGAVRMVQAVLEVLEATPGECMLLLENTVGAGHAMCATLDALGRLVRAVAHPRVGVCIDTAHLWGNGYDLSTPDGATRCVEEIVCSGGVQQGRVLHFNDSPVPLGSRRDQHAHLGEGQIGYVGLAAFITQPALAGIPTILETPDGGVDEEAIRLRAAALLCLGDTEGARALQASLPAPVTP